MVVQLSLLKKRDDRERNFLFPLKGIVWKVLSTPTLKVINRKRSPTPHLSSCVGVLNDVSGFPLFICIFLPFDYSMHAPLFKKEKNVCMHYVFFFVFCWRYACTMIIISLYNNLSIKPMMFLTLIFPYISFSLYTCVMCVCMSKQRIF